MSRYNHNLQPEPQRITHYYPESYARFVDTLNSSILPDWSKEDHDHNVAQFLADLAAHDAQVAARTLRDAADDCRAEAEAIRDGLPSLLHGGGGYPGRGQEMDRARWLDKRADWLHTRADIIARGY